MSYDFQYEHFNSVYDFEKAVNDRAENKFFRNKPQPSHKEKSDWYGSNSYDDAQSLLVNGWNAEVEGIERELRKFSNTITVKHSKQIKSIAGYAPCVPNAIRGVPKSMFSTKTVRREQNKRCVHFILNNTANSKVDDDELMRSGMTVLKLALVLDRMGVRTKIDVIPIMSTCGESCYGCTVTIKEYRHPFNLSKIAYPLAHVSFFRRHGFRYYETLDGFSNSKMAKSLGAAIKDWKEEKLTVDYFKFAGFMKDDVVYIDLNDVRNAGFDYVKLAENKGIAIA